MKSGTDLNSPLFSVVVPVYNSSQYLRQCIESVLCQTFHDFELIVVDDGSTDDSFDICTSYAEKDNRIKLLRHGCNRGASAARNTGLVAAIGEYLLFDNDDYWAGESALSKLKSSIEAYSFPDFVCYPMGELRSGMDEPLIPLDSLDDEYGPSSAYKDFVLMLINSGRFYSSASGKTVKRTLVTKYDLKFDLSLKHNEDTEWSRNLLLCSTSAGWMEEAFYIYRRNSSISQSAASVPSAVVDCLVDIVDRHCLSISDEASTDDALDVCSEFISYIYVILLSYVGMCPSRYDKAFYSKLRSQAWLLGCGRSIRVKLTNLFYRMFGCGITTRLLAFVMNCARRHIQG